MSRSEKSLIVLCLLGALLSIWTMFSPIRVMRVSSASMEPYMRVGSFCLVRRGVPLSSLQIGDVCVYRVLGGNLAAHRVIDLREGGLITKGDANEHEDLFMVTEDNFYGKTIAVF